MSGGTVTVIPLRASSTSKAVPDVDRLLRREPLDVQRALRPAAQRSSTAASSGSGPQQ